MALLVPVSLLQRLGKLCCAAPPLEDVRQQDVIKASSKGQGAEEGAAKAREAAKFSPLGTAACGTTPVATCANGACQTNRAVPYPEANADAEEADIHIDVPNAVTNPDTHLILNMLDPENGPAAGLPYQVHYLGPPRPPCEADRLATVRALNKLGTDAPDPEINNILKLVQSVFKAPAALCALFDEKQVYISEQEGGVIPTGEFPWRWTLCGWSMAFKNPQVLVIPDTLQDARFSNNEKVTIFPKVRFYCGAPLVASNGHRLGTLCFADVKPRKLDMAACVMINNLSELVVRQLEKDIALKLAQKNNMELAKTYSHLQRTVDCFDHCVVLLDTDEPGWRVCYANAAWSKQTGLPRDSLVGKTLTEVLEGADGAQLPTAAHCANAAAQRGFDVMLARVRNPDITKTFTLRFRAAGRQAVDEGAIAIGVPAFLPATGGDDKAQRFYFMVLEPPSVTPKRSSVSSSAWGGPAASGMFGQIIAAGGSHADSDTSSTSSSSSVDGLELAHLLGRGSFGWVYYGSWYGTPVAVKVIDADARNVICQTTGVHREALVAHELRHPNVVSTLKYVVRHTPGSRPHIRSSIDEEAHVQSLRASTLTSTAAAAAIHDNSSAENSQDIAAMSAMSKGGAKGAAKTPTGYNSVPKGGKGRSNSANSRGSAAAGSNSANSTGTVTSTATANGQWAVIELDTQEEGDEGGEGEEHLSEESAAVRKACRPQKDAWATLESIAGADSGAHHTGKGGELVTTNSFNNYSYTSNSVQTWIIMEFCDRGCVQDAVDRGWLRDTRDCINSHPNMEAVLSTALEVAAALRYLHAHGIVHGDLTGWNVMLTSSGANANDGNRGFVAKVADFGLARALEASQPITTRTYGTITHMPPEVLADGKVGKPMDVYSFGVLMWQMYTGSRPWSGLTHAQIIMRVVTQKAKLQWEAGAAPAYRKLAELCMAYDPAERPDFESIVRTLEAMLGKDTQ